MRSTSCNKSSMKTMSHWVKLEDMIFREKKRSITLSHWVLLLALVAALLLLVAGPGTRLGWWDFRFGFLLMRWAVYVAIATVVAGGLLLLIKKARRGPTALVVVALLVSLATAFVPLNLLQQARSLPRIHDITTNVVDIPQFVAIVPLRADAPNPIDHAGPEVIELQQSAYPDIQTYATTATPEQVFAAALAVAQDSGWRVVDQSPAEGRIEGFDTTNWFGFIDDVVIRIRTLDGSTQLDMRSKSRVGLSDVGKNAARIREFMAALDRRLND